MSDCGSHYSNTTVEPLAKSPVCSVGCSCGDPGCGTFRGLNSRGGWVVWAGCGWSGAGLMACRGACSRGVLLEHVGGISCQVDNDHTSSVLRLQAGHGQVIASWVDRLYPNFLQAVSRSPWGWLCSGASRRLPPGNPGAEQGHSCCCLSWESRPSCAGPLPRAALSLSILVAPPRLGAGAESCIPHPAPTPAPTPTPTLGAQSPRTWCLLGAGLSSPGRSCPLSPHSSRPWSMVETHPL